MRKFSGCLIIGGGLFLTLILLVIFSIAKSNFTNSVLICFIVLFGFSSWGFLHDAYAKMFGD